MAKSKSSVIVSILEYPTTNKCGHTTKGCRRIIKPSKEFDGDYLGLAQAIDGGKVKQVMYV